MPNCYCVNYWQVENSQISNASQRVAWTTVPVPLSTGENKVNKKPNFLFAKKYFKRQGEKQCQSIQEKENSRLKNHQDFLFSWKLSDRKYLQIFEPKKFANWIDWICQCQFDRSWFTKYLMNWAYVVGHLVKIS